VIVVAVVIAPLNVTDNVVGFVRLADNAVTPAMLVVNAGTPLRATGWFNTIVITDPVLVTAPTMLTGVAGNRPIRPVPAPAGAMLVLPLS
jgi:hypothetical protein